jgi:hypothetical protein
VELAGRGRGRCDASVGGGGRDRRGSEGVRGRRHRWWQW